MAKLAQGVLGFSIEKEEDGPALTSFAGAAILVETMRARFGRREWRALSRALCIKDWHVARRHVETLVLLYASGGDCIDDVAVLRRDAGLVRLLGFVPSSATQLKEFLYAFHQAPDGAQLGADADAALALKGKAVIRAEGPALKALNAFVSGVVGASTRLDPTEAATLDIDATVIEAHKKYALIAYEGTRGYQPQMAWWAEREMWIVDEFRDGNVNASFEARTFVEKAFRALPTGIREIRVRSDSALYDEPALDWMDKRHAEFAVTAKMFEPLQRVVSAVPEARWKPYRSDENDPTEHAMEEREWAEVDYVPDCPRNQKKHGLPFRYIAIRIRSRQADLLTGKPPVWKHFAVVTNIAHTAGDAILRWHRKKQGSIERGHGILKNGLGAGTLPCSRFGSNAAFWRIAVLTQNLLRLIQLKALPESMRKMEPKALRFHFLRLAGRVVSHGRKLILKLAASLPGTDALIAARKAIASIARILNQRPDEAPT